MTNNTASIRPPAGDAATTARHLQQRLGDVTQQMTDLQNEVEALVEAAAAQAEAEAAGVTPAYLTIKQAQVSTSRAGTGDRVTTLWLAHGLLVRRVQQVGHHPQWAVHT